MTTIHGSRRRVRDLLARGDGVCGTFVKLPSVEVIEVAASCLDFVVVDMEHSTLTEHDVVGLVRHADLCGLAALVRLPEVDTGLIARLLENGAAGIQLSTLTSAAQSARLKSAVRFPTVGERSLSMSNRVAGMGSRSITAFLEAEALDPPLLVGQIETSDTEPLERVLTGLDVAFVGVTDLAVSLGMCSEQTLSKTVDTIRDAARSSSVAFGGWVASHQARNTYEAGDYVVVGSDLQLLSSALRGLGGPENRIRQET